METQSSEEPRGSDGTEATPSISNYAGDGGGATASSQSGHATEVEGEEEGEEVWQRRRSLQASGGTSQEEGAGSAEASGPSAESGQVAMETDGGLGKEQARRTSCYF